ncbi:MAG: ABC transporter ATP-binding protein [Candidatus Firestonebacteria bacterium]
MGFSKPYRMTVFLIVLVMAVGSFFGLITPYLSKLFIDYILKPDPVTRTFTYSGWLIWASLALFLSYAAQQLFSGFFLERLSGSLGFKTVYDVRAAVYEKLQELSMSYFDKNQTGAILARVNQDTSELQRFLVDFVPMTLEGIIMFFGVGAFLVFLSWELTLYILIPIIPTVIFLKWIFPKVRTYFRRFYHKRAMLSALVNDSVSGIRVIKVFGQEKIEIEKFKKRSGEYRNSGIEMVKQWGIFHPILNLFIMFGTVLVWYLGGDFIFKGKMSIGDIVAYAGYLSMFYNPIRILTRMVEMISNSLSAAERVFDIVDTEPEIKDTVLPVEIKEIQGRIEFDNVSFGYNKFKPVIKRMSLDIKPNEMIGLIGRSGAGKSTMVNLICRLYDVNKGEIRIDGVDIKNIKLSDLRSQIGIVLQETFLFNGTVYDNIAYAKPGVTREEVIRASIAANAHEFILKKPDGYDTDVGERGNSLSGGEKQMVSIARAILRNPRILILDEATSSVDVQTEKKIQDALEKLTKNRTTIAIAHRLSTLRNCDRLIAIEEGEIVEVGTHKELMAKKGLFHKLITMQREFSAQASKTRAV